MSIAKKIFGTKSTRQIKKLSAILDAIYVFADSVKRMSDIELRSKTLEFKSKVKSGISLDEILPEAYAVCAEASARTIGLYPYKVQFIGGIVLHQGRIAEMKTGEGKTLVAALPAYLNALTGNGVHIVTTNDYLAKRDSEWIGKIYKFLGLSVGLIYPGQSIEDKKMAYNSDITYGTNSEFGFDYLRDNMTIYKDSLVQRGHVFAIVDEVDSILIDEARTPMIIAGESYKPSRVYIEANEFASILKYDVQGHIDNKIEENPNSEYDAVVDEACRSVTLTAKGIRKAEKKFHLDSLSSIDNSDIMGYISQAIKAHGLMKRDVDYIVEDGKVVIVDSYTGRMVPGKRYNGGLHQAIEAKENVLIENENKTMASLSIQNYFRMYKKLSGMTGTAITEEEEFAEIYNLDVVEIPTNKPMVRKDHSDVVYRNKRGKINAIIKQVQQCYEKGQPVLIGTISVEGSEEISRRLKKLKLPHNVLNAKNHAREADIIAQAGRKGAITVATNMAGRGTDIILGGNIEALITDRLVGEGYDKESIQNAIYRYRVYGSDNTELCERITNLEQELKEEIDVEAAEVKELGGLFIIGTERHDARRIDNQLRGRSGRQGDPGESQFFLSFEDDVMRKFGSDRILPVLESLNMDENTPIENRALSGMIEQAQKKVESQNFQVRKSLIAYDDVLNIQREIIYKQRRQVLDGLDISSQIRDMIDKVAHRIVTEMDETKVVTAQVDTIVNRLITIIPDVMETRESLLERFSGNMNRDDYYNTVTSILTNHYTVLSSTFSSVIREVERVTLLFIVDKSWAMHLSLVEDARKATKLQAYGMVQPIDAFRKQVSEYFEQLVEDIQLDTVRKLFHIHLA